MAKLRTFTARITEVKRGRHKGEFKFRLYAKNGEPVSQSWPESYTSLQMCKKTLKNCFPEYVIVQKQ